MKLSLTIFSLLFSIFISFGQRLNTPPLSPNSKLSQQIGLTEISIEYARPSAKGRSVFGDLVPFGKIWRTGANASTKITLTEAGKIGGNDLEAGTYALYTIPEKDSWTIIIHSNTKMRSLAGDVYKQADDVFRFKVPSQEVTLSVETFTLQFADLSSNSVNLQLTWANTLINIPIDVEVDQKIAQQMTEFLKTPDTIPHRTYFEAAQYYLNNGKDLNEALSFINAGLEKSPKNFRYGLLKSKIQDRAGDRKAALKTINEANQWAVDAENANYIEQTDLFRQDLKKGNKN